MPELKRGEAKLIHEWVESFSASFERTVVEVLARELRGIEPPSVRELREQLTLLMRQLESRQGVVRVHEAMDGLVKRVVLWERRRVAESLEVPLAKAIEPGVVGALQRELRRFDDMMGAAWFVDARAQRIPRLTDYLSVRFAAEAMPFAPPLLPREYDEKFHILEAPRLFLPDLARCRHECALRAADVTVAYVDIDDFKEVNSRFMESVVDLKVLIPFMELVEAWAFGHAHAYRFGGDEYVVLIANAGRVLASSLLEELARRVVAKEFHGTDVRLSISLGACVVDPDCPLTDREILARANSGKAEAKAKKKGSLVLYTAPEYR